MHSNMRIGAVIAQLRKEIADKQTALATLEALVAGNESPPESAPVKMPVERQYGMGKAAVEILKAAGRPLHGRRELLPALEAKGFKVRTTHIATMLMRTKQVTRTAPGTFAYKPNGKNSA